MRPISLLAKLFVVVISLTAPSAVFANTPEQLYQTCIACHGEQGQGNSAVNAPAIAGQHAWYTTRQLQNFISGVRGAHEKDVLGKQMKAMTSQLEPNKDVPVLADYIATLPGKVAKQEISGDLMNGSRYYQAKCGACHGGKAEGNKSFHAPRLAGQDVSYLQRQMKNFVEGVRGSHAEDKLGKQMAMMAKIVSDKELSDIIFYISQQQ
ncbi:cytochrome c [Thalassotalea sp. M1531]|uniref:Cytochrome c n=1 Tax=Thalassotalea algicola TaxID=2716224 RepID=A0A7Y0LAV2_9GAMM|nr:c-type cytochrome [Thalassotalea algicola]NMP30854.1 cytochrome c [Thalassotalea algicola]